MFGWWESKFEIVLRMQSTRRTKHNMGGRNYSIVDRSTDKLWDNKRGTVCENRE